jgi:hypothetical protein
MRFLYFVIKKTMGINDLYECFYIVSRSSKNKAIAF